MYFTSASRKNVGFQLLCCLTFSIGCVSSFYSFDNMKPLPFSMTKKISMWKGSDLSSMHDEEKQRRQVEFLNLEPLPQTDARRARLEQDVENRAQFAKYGDELWDLRDSIQELSSRLMGAMHNGDTRQEQRIRDKLFRTKQRDPELVYRLALQASDVAQRNGQTNEAELHMTRATAARCCLPQFNLEGLWVGKYGNHGYEMINVTYSGDVLTAVKVTGDQNVPRGEITFQVDLSPLSPPRTRGSNGMDEIMPLKPITLTQKAAKKWGTRFLPRHRGMGQVAEPGFVNNQWMDGQLIIIGEEYFSFAWVPIEHQIFFGRPSPELALRMLREAGAIAAKTVWDAPPSLQDDPRLLKEYASHCLEMTTEVIEENWKGSDAFGCIWHGMETEECYFE